MKCSCGKNMVWVQTQSTLNSVTVYYSCSCGKVKQDMVTWDIASWDLQPSRSWKGNSQEKRRRTQ